MLSKPFSRTAIGPLSFLLFVLFILSGSPGTFATSTVLFLAVAVTLTMLLVFCRELSRAIVRRVPRSGREGIEDHRRPVL